MSTRRKWLIVLAGIGSVAALIALAAEQVHERSQQLGRSRLIDREHCALIKEGMTQAEVEALLGGPPGDYRTQPGQSVLTAFDAGALAECRAEQWLGDQGGISVAFDKQDRVGCALFSPALPDPSPAP